MYEIWLAGNIVWEIALTQLPWVTAYGVLLAAVWLLAWRARPLPWRRSLLLAAICAALVWLIAMLAVPPLTGASYSDLAYWVDWANLFAIAAGFGGAAMGLLWPLIARLGRRAQG